MYSVLRPDDFEWIMRPHEPGQAARHVAELSDRLGSHHVRGNVAELLESAAASRD